MDEISVSMIVVTLWETFGWLFVVGSAVAVLLLIMLVTAFLRRRRAQQPFGGLLWRGVLVTLVSAVIITPFVPLWTLAPVGDLRGFVDYVIAYSMALAPASIIGVLWVYFGSMRSPRPA